MRFREGKSFEEVIASGKYGTEWVAAVRIYPELFSYFLLTTLVSLLSYIGYVGFPVFRKRLYSVHRLNPGPQIVRKP